MHLVVELVGDFMLLLGLGMSVFVWCVWLYGANRIVEDKSYRDDLQVASTATLIFAGGLFVFGAVTWLVGLVAGH